MNELKAYWNDRGYDFYSEPFDHGAMHGLCIAERNSDWKFSVREKLDTDQAEVSASQLAKMNNSLIEWADKRNG